MNGGVIIPDKDTAKALNDLARHTAIVRILNDIRMDMEICEIEGWDKNEYLNLIRQLLNSIGDKTMNDSISRQAAKLKVLYGKKGDTAEDFNDKCVDCLDDVQPEEAIPVSWIEAKIELVNSLPGVSMLKMKTADWRDLVEQWKAEQRNPEVDHDAQIREFAEEMSKHGVK